MSAARAVTVRGLLGRRLARRQLAVAGYTGRARVIIPKHRELAGACSRPMFTIEDRAARHTGDPWLTTAVGAAAVLPTRAAWTWDDRHAHAAELLQAVTSALHAREHGRCPYDLLKSVAWCRDR